MANLYNIQTHIFDHAHAIHKGTDNNFEDKFKHFKCSIDTSYFLVNGYKTQQEIDEVMVKIFNTIKERILTVKENNGIYINKHGKRKQKTRTRTIRFDNISMAYHSEHFDRSKSVNPHFHYIISNKMRVGIGYTYLKEVIAEEATEFKLKFHFMESKQNNGLTRGEEMTLNTLSWTIQQGKTDKIHNFLKNPTHLTRSLDLLCIHYRNTLNISFFTKIIKSLHQRFCELDIDFMFQGINLKNEIFFFLNDIEKQTIERLQKLQHVELDLQYVLDREILKYAHGFSSEAMEMISEHFHINAISPQQLTIVNDNLSVKTRVKHENHFRNLVIGDVQMAIRQAHSEKHMKELLLNGGVYQQIVTRTQNRIDKNRKKIGFTLTTQKNAQIYVPFSELEMDFKQITKIYINNTKKKLSLNEFQSQIGNYKKKKRTDAEKVTTSKMALYRHKPKLLISIYMVNEHPTKNYIFPEKIADKYQIFRSELYNITTFKSKNITFVDYGDRITVIKSPQFGHKNIISDMLDMAVIKGWNLREVDINGDDYFGFETKKQIKMRHIPLVNLQKHTNKIKP